MYSHKFSYHVNFVIQDYERYDPKAPGLIGVGPLPPAASSHILPPSVGDDLDSEPGKFIYRYK